MTNAANRALWVVLGLLLVAVGVFGILANRDQIPGLDSRSFLFWPALMDFWRDLGDWGPIAIVATGIVLVILGSWLLRAQLQRRGAAALPDITVRKIGKASNGTKKSSVSTDPAEIPGTTTVRSHALTHGFEGDLKHIPYVSGTQVALTGESPTPTIWLRLDLDPQADLSVIRDHVNVALNRFNLTSGLSPAHMDVTARVGAGSPAARVR